VGQRLTNLVYAHLFVQAQSGALCTFADGLALAPLFLRHEQIDELVGEGNGGLAKRGSTTMAASSSKTDLVHLRDQPTLQ